MPTARAASLAAVLLVALAAVPGRAGPDPPAAQLVASGKQPSVAIGPSGEICLTFVEGNVKFLVSKDRGKTFSQPVVAIDAKGRAGAGRQRGPRIGIDARGRIVVTAPLTFDDAEAKKKYPTPELVLVRSEDGGATWTAPLRVNEVEKKAPEGLHALRVAADGTAHVVWLDHRDRMGPGQDLWYARVEGGKAGPNARIAEDVCECCAPGLALDAAGNPFVAWREGGKKPSREIFSSRSTDGGKSFAKPVRVNGTATGERMCPMSAPAVAVTLDGRRFAAAWKDVREGSPRVWWALADTPSFPKEASISDAAGVVCDHPSLAVDSRGVFWAAWEEGQGADARICVRTSAADGAAREVSERGDGPPGYPVMAVGADLVVAAWEVTVPGAPARVYFRVLDDTRR